MDYSIDEFEDGTLLKIEKFGSRDQAYAYAAVKAKDSWWVTGTGSAGPMSDSTFADWLRPFRPTMPATRVYWAKSVDEVER